ncbi:hypothetical protein OQA88_13427 [Cercophora sp. LCS_1]
MARQSSNLIPELIKYITVVGGLETGESQHIQSPSSTANNTFSVFNAQATNNMHLPRLLLAAVSALPAVNAWHVEMIQRHRDGDTRGAMTYDSGSVFYDRDFNGGCRDRRLPSVLEFCLDFANARGHFIQEDNRKLCLRPVGDYPMWIRDADPNQLIYSRWEKVACTWRLANETDVEEADLNTPLLAPTPIGEEYQPFGTAGK